MMKFLQRCVSIITITAVSIFGGPLLSGLSLVQTAHAAVESRTISSVKIKGKDTWVLEVTFTSGNKARYLFHGSRGAGKQPIVEVETDTGSGYESKGDNIAPFTYWLQHVGDSTPWNMYDGLTITTTGDNVLQQWNLTTSTGAIVLTQTFTVTDALLPYDETGSVSWTFPNDPLAIAPVIALNMTDINYEAGYSEGQVNTWIVTDIPGKIQPADSFVPWCSDTLLTGINENMVVTPDDGTFHWTKTWTPYTYILDLSALGESHVLDYAGTLIAIGNLFCD